MPVIDDPMQVPHIIFWTPHGLVKKIILRIITPPPSFWLTQEELGGLGQETVLEVWPGELDPDIEMDDSESEGDEDDEDEDTDDEGVQEEEAVIDGEAGRSKKKKKNKNGSDDVRVIDGVSVGAIVADKEGNPSETDEYIPGGSLVISIQVRRQKSIYFLHNFVEH